MKKHRGVRLLALRDSMHEIGQTCLAEGRADIAGAGRFGQRWKDGLQAAEDFGPERSTLTIFHTIFYWTVFEFGAVIKGKPLLWIPLSFAVDAIGVMARNFPGGLFRVDRKAGGAPLLLSRATGEPKYFGKEQVTIPKKFHLRAICARVLKGFKALYLSKLD